MSDAIHALIMAGGSGTRFWPASRRARPKQLLELVKHELRCRDPRAKMGFGFLALSDLGQPRRFELGPECTIPRDEDRSG